MPGLPSIPDLEPTIPVCPSTTHNRIKKTGGPTTAATANGILPRIYRANHIAVFLTIPAGRCEGASRRKQSVSRVKKCQNQSWHEGGLKQGASRNHRDTPNISITLVPSSLARVSWPIAYISPTIEPSNTSTMDGGIICPRVPEVAITPVEISLE